MSDNAKPIVQMSRTECFSAAHRLHSTQLSDEDNLHTYGKCNNPNGHGHNYVWKVVLEGSVDAVTGMVYDLEKLKTAMKAVLDSVDHKNLDKDVDFFRLGGMVSTTENLAVHLYGAVKQRLDRPELLKRVVVRETNKNKFAYSGEMGHP